MVNSVQRLHFSLLNQQRSLFPRSCASQRWHLHLAPWTWLIIHPPTSSETDLFSSVTREDLVPANSVVPSLPSPLPVCSSLGSGLLPSCRSLLLSLTGGSPPTELQPVLWQGLSVFPISFYLVAQRRRHHLSFFYAAVSVLQSFFSFSCCFIVVSSFVSFFNFFDSSFSSSSFP